MLKFPTRFSKITHVVFFLVLFTGCGVTLLADGLPGEYYVTQRWRDLLAGHSPATNPAFMTEENYLTIRGAVCPTLQNSFILMEIGAILPIGLYQSVGVTYLGLSTREDIAQTEWDPDEGKIVPTGDSLNDNHALIIMSYAINPFNRFSVGANANIFHQTNFGDAITGLSFDLALSYRFLRHSLLGDHIAGITFQNLLSPDFDFKSWSTLSINMKISWLARIWEKRIEAGIDLDIKDFTSQAADFAESLGGKEIEFDFNFRIGCWILRMVNVYFQAGSDYLGIAGGLNVPTVNNGRDFQVAYQYMSITDDVDITSSHTVYFRGDFGKHREEIYARRMARLASIGPADLYNRARTLYSQGKYWNSFYIFGKILVEYPDFFKNDWVQLHLGLCQEHLDMREFSAENYNETKKAFPRSVVVPYADLGLMRLHYRDGNSSGVANQFSRLNTPTVPDSIKYHAYYYMGLQHIRDGEYQKAIQILDLIPEDHPEYAFGQHSLGIACALSNNLSRSIEAWDNVIQTTPKTKEQEEVINRSFVFLGYVFYEGLGGQERALSKAVSALRKVPSNSYYYEDALIGLAWTALRASQWADCLAACDQLVGLSKKPALQCEAMLLKGYCFMMDRKYPEAVAVLTPAYDKVTKAMSPSENEKGAAKLEYDNNRGVYYEIASKTNELALTSQSSYVLQQIDSLHAPQVEYKKKLHDFYIFNDEFSRRAFFSRNIENVRNDIEYALAKAEKMAGTRKEDKIKKEAVKESEKIEDEMKKLEEELKKLEEEE